MRELLVLTAVLLTVGCATTAPPPAPSVRATPAVVTPVPVPRPEAGSRTTPMPVPRPENVAVEPFRMERLGGAAETAVVAMIGRPDEIRERPPGKIWVYNHGACRVEVYLYPSVDVGSMAVLGSSIAPNTLTEGERERCRRSLSRRTAKAS